MIKSAPSALAGDMVNQYWQLIKAMLFNSKVIGYLVVLFLGIGLAAFLLGICVPSLWPIGSAFALVSLLIISMLGFTGLPIGMLILIANKNISLMANVRSKLFFIVFAFSLLVIGIYTLSLLNVNKLESSIILFWTCLFICPLFFVLAIFIASKDIGIAMFSPLFMVMVVKLGLTYISVVNVAFLVMGNVAGWALFYTWWMRFSPSGEIKKSFFLQLDKTQMQQSIWDKLLVFRTKKINTAMGTFMLGHSDHVISFLKRMTFTYSFSFVFSVYILGGFKDFHLDEEPLRIAVFFAFAYSFILMTMDFYSRKMMLNLQRVWLVFPGDREGLFCYLESFFWRGMRLLVGLNIALLSLFLLATQSMHYLLYVSIGAMMMSLIVVFDFYWDMAFYKKHHGFDRINFQKVVINSAAVLLVCYYLVEKYSNFNVLETRDIIILLMMVFAVLLLKPLRKYCIKRIKMVDI